MAIKVIDKQTAINLLEELDHPTLNRILDFEHKLVNDFEQKKKLLVAIKEAIRNGRLEHYKVSFLKGNVEHLISIKGDSRLFQILEQNDKQGMKRQLEVRSNIASGEAV